MPFKTADLLDDAEGEVQVVAPGLKNFGGRARFHGPMATVVSDNDNSRVREYLWAAGEGRVLVIDNGGSLTCAMLGDMMAAKAIENGWAGIVINGCIRDSVEVGAMELGVKAVATNPRRSDKQDRGEAGVILEFHDAVFRPGEYLYSDEDGMLLSAEPLL